MSIREDHRRRVSFDTREELGNKIDKLAVMIGKLATRASGTNRQFKPKTHQSRGNEVRTGVTVSETITIGTDRMTDQIAETEVGTDKIEVGLGMNHDMNRIKGEVILEGM